MMPLTLAAVLRFTEPAPANVRPFAPVISEEIVALPLSQTMPSLSLKARPPPLMALPLARMRPASSVPSPIVNVSPEPSVIVSPLVLSA